MDSLETSYLPPCTSSTSDLIESPDADLTSSSSSTSSPTAAAATTTKILDDDVTVTTDTEKESDVREGCCCDENLLQRQQSNSSTTTTSTTTSSGLGTPLHILFNSSSRNSSSQIESPVSSSPDINLLNGLDQLLHRITSERFLELRRIQLGDRPVTSGNARSSIENFFNRAIHGPTAQERSDEEEANRPENVANDVQSLIQLSRVRSALQNGFRNQLEAVFGGRSSQPVPQSTQSNRNRNQTQATSQMQRSLTSTTPSGRSQNTRGEVHFPPPPPSTIPPPPPPHQQPHPPSTGLQDTVEASVHLLTESIATDITRLQSLQVVNNILRTDFRQELERMVQERVARTGTNGEAVSQFIRSLPPSTTPISRQRNHHTSHMPIIRENSSSMIASGAASRDEVHELRQQLQEMKQMLAMSMEIQLDTQRAIRQEVSAVFTAYMQEYLVPRTEQNSTWTPTLVQPARSTPIQRGQCVICVDKSVDTVLYQCGHMCVCNACGLQLKMNGQSCPMCRAPIRDVIRTYVAAEE